MRNKGTAPSGRVCLATAIGSAGPEIAIVLKELATAYPELSFELRFTADPVGALANGADVAMVFGQYPLGDWKVTSLGEVHLRAFAAPGYLAERGHPEAPEDLAHHRLLHATSLLPSLPAAWPTLDGGTLPIAPWLTTTDVDAVRQAVVASLGVGLGFTDAADDELRPVLPAIIGVDLKVWALTTPIGAKLARVRAVIDGARRYLSDGT